MKPDTLVNKLSNIHRIVQDLEFSGLSDALTDDEYRYIYSALKDAREFIDKETN